MERETTYKGSRVHIQARRSPDGKWLAHAEFTDRAGVPTKTAEQAYASEQEAFTATLSAAAAEIDRRRERIGKP